MTGSERFARMKSQGKGGRFVEFSQKTSRLELIPKHEAPGQELGGVQMCQTGYDIWDGSVVLSYVSPKFACLVGRVDC